MITLAIPVRDMPEHVPPSKLGDFDFSDTHIELSNTFGETL